MAQSDVYELRQVWSIANVPAQTTFHIAVDETNAGNPLFRAEAIELAWFDHFALSWFFALPRNVVYRRVMCGRINNTGGPWYRNTRLTPGNPANPAAYPAAMCTGVVGQALNHGSWISQRLRFPGVSLSAVTNNRISDPVSLNMGSIASLMLQSWNFAGATYECVCWSRTSATWSHFVSARPINFVQPLKSRRPGFTRRVHW